ncbi:glycosyltransferase [Loktanella sp. TSTF-M6]|uniref:Glycosyltransferase n=1 Tax=Loktanella gaetbuli TaxID=2881335 RepID=A0ABS8BY82_9RHOB|nr:glycosyltransferase [Loktanella gaetbuli]MCB5200685.1 glycosyltransferase [Loktanella gaetbuli]
MTLCAIVVTFNRLAELQITLPRLLAEDVDHIVVVDNASTDATPNWLPAQASDRVHVIRLDDNTGGAGGFEAGMAYARDQLDPDWVVLMDDDARPAPGALAVFRRETPGLESQFPRLGCVAAAVFYPDGTLCEMNRPSRNPFWHAGLFAKTLFTGSRAGFHVSDAAFAPDAPALPLDVASFVGYFVHRDAVAKIGLPEGGLFIYGDDVLYSLRLRRAGFTMALAPSVRFEHDCGTLGEGFVYRPLWKIYYHCRNGVSIARQAAGPIVFPAALAYYTLMWWRRGRHTQGVERRTYYKLMRMGLRDGLLRRRGRNDTAHALARAADKPAQAA